MQANRTEAVVGGLVLLTAAAFLTYALGVTGQGPSSGRYPLTASFRSVEGISEGTEIRMAGVRIGRVGDLALDRETFRAEATLMIDDGVPVPEDSTVAITSEGILGGNFVEIVPGGALEELSSGEEILDTQGAVSLIGLLMKFVAANEGN